MDDVRLVRTAYGFDVETTGYSTTREIRQATFRFNAVEGSNLKTTELTIDLLTSANVWFLSEVSKPLGSVFHYVQAFTVRGDIKDIDSVSVTLINTRGSSETRTGKFLLK
jgi:hypothetical protein